MISRTIGCIGMTTGVPVLWVLMVMNLPTRLHELTDKEVPVKEIAAAAAAGGTLGHFKPLTQGDIEKILMLAA